VTESCSVATLTCFPDAEIFRDARPRTGWASFPMEDTWSERPYVQGAVLIGDAAGYSDPILGQGLTVAIRDARLVGDALLRGPSWGPTSTCPAAGGGRHWADSMATTGQIS